MAVALEVGDANSGTGLAGAIAAAREEAYGKSYSVAKDAGGVNALAKAIIEYLVANAEVEVTELPGGTPVDPPGIGTIK